MANSRNDYTGNGSLTAFSVSFPYFDVLHIQVLVDSALQTLTTHYTFDSGTNTINFVTAPATDAVIVIRRFTPRETANRNVIFPATGDFSQADLNNAHLNQLYILQEFEDGGVATGNPLLDLKVNIAGDNVTDLSTYRTNMDLGTKTQQTANVTAIALNTTGTANALVNTTARLKSAAKVYVADVGNVTTGEDDLINYDIPVGDLAVNKDIIVAKFAGNMVGSSSDKDLRVRVNSTVIVATEIVDTNGGSAEYPWVINVHIVRVSSTSVRVFASVEVYGILSASQRFADANRAFGRDTLTGLSSLDANVLNLRITGEAVSTNDIIMESGYINTLATDGS